jgi:hypothetical protein
MTLAPSPEQHRLLAEIVAAGPPGVHGPDLMDRGGDLAALALAGLVDVGPDRRVVATPRGKTFNHRSAFA